LRINTFLGKWLEYLVDRGHGDATLSPLGRNLQEIQKTA